MIGYAFFFFRWKPGMIASQVGEQNHSLRDQRGVEMHLLQPPATNSVVTGLRALFDPLVSSITYDHMSCHDALSVEIFQ